ncbi:MAG TPA: ferritin family protein [Tepidisphaeraceae bacterium]|nr:ferritin family protein [Tepidisphaeraceae bacterium]
MLLQRVGIIIAFAMATAVGSSWAGAAGAKAATLDNLQAAYNGESNAAARYSAFAQKADAEGYGAVASLFRAAAKAEQIHAAAHAAVIKKLGAQPKADMQEPEVKGTKENLQAAIKGETYERDTMYPEFLKQARADGNADAVRSFNYAKTAEAEHAKLYQQALDNIDQWKSGSRQFYVCPTCGYTVSQLSDKKCPSCYEPTDKYQKVS